MQILSFYVSRPNSKLFIKILRKKFFYNFLFKHILLYFSTLIGILS